MVSVPPRLQRALRRPTRARSDLIERLIEIFVNEGFAGESIDSLARRLRCSKSTLYTIAASKEQIITLVVKAFFRRATERVEARIIDVEPATIERIKSYLTAISVELSTSPEFLADVDAFAPTRELYLENTRLASVRLQGLIVEAVPATSHAEALFIANVAAGVMNAIHRGEVESGTSLDDAAAYRALARLIVAGVETWAPAPDK